MEYNNNPCCCLIIVALCVIVGNWIKKAVDRSASNSRTRDGMENQEERYQSYYGKIKYKAKDIDDDKADVEVESPDASDDRPDEDDVEMTFME